MAGLARRVEIAEYDPKWAMLYRNEKGKIEAAIGHVAVAVEHIGSTAVPSLGAKPVIDIMVAVRRLSDANKCVEPLRSIGYEYQPEHEDTMPERRFFRKGEPPREQHYHLHMVEEGSEFWKQHLAFRDYLRTHPEKARQYHELKEKLASEYGSDREGYTKAKTQFIESVVNEAMRRRE